MHDKGIVIIKRAREHRWRTTACRLRDNAVLTVNTANKYIYSIGAGSEGTPLSRGGKFSLVVNAGNVRIAEVSYTRRRDGWRDLGVRSIRIDNERWTSDLSEIVDANRRKSVTVGEKSVFIIPSGSRRKA